MSVATLRVHIDSTDLVGMALHDRTFYYSIVPIDFCVQSRLEVLSEQELDLLSRKRRMMQNEIKVERRGQELDEREQVIRERETYLLEIEESVKEYSQVAKVGLMKSNECFCCYYIHLDKSCCVCPYTGLDFFHYALFVIEK